MDVQAAHARRVQDRRGQDQPIGRDDGAVEIECLEFSLSLRVAQRLRRADGNSPLFRQHMDGGALYLMPAPGGAGRLAVDTDHLMAGIDQRLQAECRKIGRAHECETETAHARHS